jgi:hypothetical protein
MPQNNSAWCLHQILKSALDDGKESEPIYRALASGLKIENPDLEKHKYIDFFVLVKDVESSVKSLKKVYDLDEFVSSIQELSDLIFINGLFQGPWKAVSSRIREGKLLTVLISCAMFIDQEQAYPDLSDEQLKQYLDECEELIKKITESDLEESIKSFLIIRLEEICVAIRQYHLGGTESLKKVIEENIGGVLLRLSGLGPEEKGKSLNWEVFNWLIHFGGVLDLAANTQGYLIPKLVEAVQQIQHLLPPGTK